MRIVGDLDAHRPALPQAVFDLRGDLLIGEIGQEREGTLGHAHYLYSPVQLATAVGTKSDVSVEV